MRKRMVIYWTAAIWALVVSGTNESFANPPSLIFILADDLGYGDLGCYGQRLIRTPRLDQMAAEGMRFTQFYAGSTVCAPSRCVLMTGKHLGHCTVRGNGKGPEQALRDADRTVAEELHAAGYATALIGKWGLGDMRPETAAGMPNRQGFDLFFGYANQVHAHNYYPVFLWRNEQMEGLPNIVRPAPNSYGGFQGGTATRRLVYSHDRFAEEAMDWIREHRHRPFFLYLSLTIPHANNEATRMSGDGAEVPDYGIYADRDWPKQDKGQAAMITRMDRDIGNLLDLLRQLGIAETTLVLFSSDNGPHDEAGHHPERFQPSGPFRGMKRDLYEGGIRVPAIAWWPETVPAGSVSPHIAYFGDLMATACNLAGTKPPENLDSISLLPTLTGRPENQLRHNYLYWEFYEQGGRRAVRQGQWKAVRPLWNAPIELYNLDHDPAESSDLADQHPDVVDQMAALMEEAHSPSPYWEPPPATSP